MGEGLQQHEVEDDALMRRAANRDTVAFGQIVRRYQSPLLRAASRFLVNDTDMAADAVQETFLRLWQAAPTYSPQGNLRAYLYRILYNLCRDARRRERTTDRLEDFPPFTSASPTPEIALDRRLLSDAVRCAVEELPEGQRAVFLLNQYEGLSYRAIAAILDCPEGTVASRKHLALEALRHRLQPWMTGEDNK